jgi:hypothetical protein
MAAQIPTTEDLERVKQEILSEVRKLFEKENSCSPGKWLRSTDVCKLLGISSSGLQNLRNSGVLPYSKLNGAILFNREHIEEILKENLKNNAGK